MKVGIGFDVHPFKKDRNLILGGIQIEYEFGLYGHSDADVLTHALMDAILGALGAGDIGQHFPDDDPQYRDIDSMILLDRVHSLMKKKKYLLNNADLIIMAETPRIASYRHKIIENLGKRLNAPVDRINIKATTTEGLGFVGRKEGIAAQAIVSLIKYRRR